MKTTVGVLLVACVLTGGCKELTRSSGPTATATPTGSVTVGVAVPTGLAVAVARDSALVTWNKPSVGIAPRAYELRLDAQKATRIPAGATSHRLRGLMPGSKHTVWLATVGAAGRSLEVSAPFTMPAAPVATKPSAAPTAPPAAVPRRSPSGRLVIVGYQRLPHAQQTRYGCDRLYVTLANQSDTPIKTVGVGFSTYWGGEQLGDGTQPGRNVTVTRQQTIAAGARQTLQFDVCLPEKKTRNVYAEPVGTTWLWAS